MTEYSKMYEKSAKGKFVRQKSNARARGIEWNLTFEEWLKIWEDSGKWEERGRTANSYVMSRKFDNGPYSVDNVVIVTSKKNSRDSFDMALSQAIRRKPVRPNPWYPTPDNIWPLDWATEEAKKNNPFLRGEPYVSEKPLF